MKSKHLFKKVMECIFWIRRMLSEIQYGMHIKRDFIFYLEKWYIAYMQIETVRAHMQYQLTHS